MGPRMVQQQQQQGMGLDRQAMAMMSRQGMQGLGLQPNQGMVARPQQYKYTQVCMMSLDCVLTVLVL